MFASKHSDDGRPLRILLAADVPPDPSSGAGGTIVQTADALRKRGHRVESIWTGDLTRRIGHGNLHYLLELPWSYRGAIDRRCHEAQYDVIQVSQPYGWLAAREHHTSGRPGVFVSRSHGWEPRVVEALRPWRSRLGEPEWRFPRGMVGRPLRALLLRYAELAAQQSDGILTSCSECADFIRRRHAVSGDRIATVPLAAPDSFRHKPAVPMTEERLAGILYVGQFAFVKAPSVLAGVFNRLADERPGVRLTWCCASEHHEAARALFSEKARSVVSLVGWRSQEELIELYDRHGIFLFPSFFEGFGKAFLEAMARGLCVVASNTGGMRDVIRDGEDGALTAVGDVEATVERTTHLLDDLGKACRMAAGARETALRYTWDRVANQTADFYRRLVDAREAI